MERARAELGDKLVYFTMKTRDLRVKHYWGLSDLPLPKGASVISRGRSNNDGSGKFIPSFFFTTRYFLRITFFYVFRCHHGVQLGWNHNGQLKFKGFIEGELFCKCSPSDGSPTTRNLEVSDSQFIPPGL